MTMSRKTKADHQFEVKYSRLGAGYTAREFSSPREIAARGGRTRMTTAEYIEYAMHRGQKDTANTRELFRATSRHPRRTSRKG